MKDIAVAGSYFLLAIAGVFIFLLWRKNDQLTTQIEEIKAAQAALANTTLETSRRVTNNENDEVSGKQLWDALRNTVKDVKVEFAVNNNQQQ